jgi:ketosteroid isomerase-like protein
MAVALMGLVLALSSCLQLGASTPKQQERVRQAISQAGLSLANAFNGGKADVVADFYQEDAILLPPNSLLVSGRPGILRFWQSFIGSTIWRELNLQIFKIKYETELAVEMGTYTLRMKANEQSPITTENGKYVVTWALQGDGTWKIVADIWNANQ